MKTSLLLSTVLLVAGTALADVNYNMAIEQAKRVAKNPGPDGQPPQQPPSSAPQAPPANPELAATMKNIADLRMDIATLVKADDAAAADKQRIPLLNHLSAAAQDTKASSDSVKKLAKDLIDAISRKNIPAAQQTVLARYLHALFNAAHLSDAQQKSVLDGVKKIFAQAEVADVESDKVLADLKSIASETK